MGAYLSIYSTLFPSSVFLISVIVLFITDCLFFQSYMSLLNIYCIFLIHASALFIYAYIVSQRFWINFPIITLNTFSCRLPISSAFVSSCGVLPCSFIYWMFLCLLILFNLLHLGSSFWRVEGCFSPPLWSLPPLGGIGLITCEGFLVGGICACFLIGWS